MKIISYCFRKNGELFHGMKLWIGEVVDFMEMVEDDDNFEGICILNVHEVLDEEEWGRWEDVL